jgi:hypothetical protein
MGRTGDGSGASQQRKNQVACERQKKSAGSVPTGMMLITVAAIMLLSVRRSPH